MAGYNQGRTRPLVLYIDDSNQLLKLAELFLHAIGTDFVGAATAEEGIALAKKRLPDLILMDVVLPGMDGFDATRELKQHKATKDIPILMLTGTDKDNDIKMALDAGANGYIVKPIHKDRLEAKLKEWIRLPSAD